MIFFKKSPATSHQPLSTLLVGLGNPGAEYEGNRHNVGFMALDRIADTYRFPAYKKKFGGAVTEGEIDGKKLLLLKPLTFMNISGESVAACAHFYKIQPTQVFVLHDELDLPLGKLRVKMGGGHGGHNGLKSIDAHLGKEYRRVRIGIGHPGDKDAVSDYVLSDFPKAEKKQVDTMNEEIARHIALLLAGNEAEFMNRISLAVHEPPPTTLKSRN